MKKSLIKFFEYCINIVYPKLCISCKVEITESNELCSDCFKQVDFITEPYCYKCGEPFVVEHYKNFECISCYDKDLKFERAKAVYRYHTLIRDLIADLKFNGRTSVAQFLAKKMHFTAKEFLVGVDFLIPVPSHLTSIRKRGYNQAALIAKNLSKLTKIKCLYDGLEKVLDTHKQHKKTKKDRFADIKGAFRVNRKYKKLLRLKNIVIVDDVLTTGATASECAKVLRPYCRSIRVIAAAKTCKG